MQTGTWTLIVLLAVVACTLATSPVETPPPGSPLRQAIMDALRVPVQKDLKQKVVFRVDLLSVKDGWAYFRGQTRKPDGSLMDYRRTKYWKQIQLGRFEDWLCALLKLQDGKWRVVEFLIGHTDEPSIYLLERYGAPRELWRPPLPD